MIRSHFSLVLKIGLLVLKKYYHNPASISNNSLYTNTRMHLLQNRLAASCFLSDVSLSYQVDVSHSFLSFIRYLHEAPVEESCIVAKHDGNVPALRVSQDSLDAFSKHISMSSF